MERRALVRRIVDRYCPVVARAPEVGAAGARRAPGGDQVTVDLDPVLPNGQDRARALSAVVVELDELQLAALVHADLGACAGKRAALVRSRVGEEHAGGATGEEEGDLVLVVHGLVVGHGPVQDLMEFSGLHADWGRDHDPAPSNALATWGGLVRLELRPPSAPSSVWGRPLPQADPDEHSGIAWHVQDRERVPEWDRTPGRVARFSLRRRVWLEEHSSGHADRAREGRRTELAPALRVAQWLPALTDRWRVPGYLYQLDLVLRDVERNLGLVPPLPRRLPAGPVVHRPRVPALVRGRHEGRPGNARLVEHVLEVVRSVPWASMPERSGLEVKDVDGLAVLGGPDAVDVVLAPDLQRARGTGGGQSHDQPGPGSGPRPVPQPRGSSSLGSSRPGPSRGRRGPAKVGRRRRERARLVHDQASPFDPVLPREAQLPCQPILSPELAATARPHDPPGRMQPGLALLVQLVLGVEIVDQAGEPRVPGVVHRDQW